MILEYTPEQRAFRQEVRGWMEANVPSAPLPSFDLSPEGFEAHRDWERKLSDGRWGMVTWPEELGGRGLDLIRWLIFEEEYYRAGAPTRVNQNGIFLLGPTMMEFGTEDQKARFLPRMAAGDDVWAQAWSEPGAGSDLAGVRSTCTRDGDDYILNGQKIWSTRAVFADWAFGLFREPGSERHKGMSLILFPLDAPGVTRRPIARMDGELVFAEVFLDNVRVPAADRLGDEGQGWHVCMATAGFERGLLLRSPGPLPGHGVETDRALRAREGQPARLVRRAAGPALDGCRGLCADHLCDGLAAGGGRHDRSRGIDQQDLLVGARHRDPPDRSRHAG